MTLDEMAIEIWSGLFVVIALLVLLVTWLDIPGALWRYYRVCKLLKPIPGEPMHWFWGHLLDLKGMDEKVWNSLHAGKQVQIY